ncbi:hypothetical protein CK203_025244 [Vitis vinifera]|uniref:Reverse transcriptase domain-containing protein n=1 Tax=Vitis vinifera TaxID=29760 RepID=A0A438JF95_VITVI|nr:hypothetical protein CK203_025244 [Vitis vinifera]
MREAIREKGVVFKIDFEKAYDHVRWDFLDQVLEKKGFSPKWRKWMSGCLSSVSYAVLVNGSAKGWVKASRGLRQGRLADSQESFVSIWAYFWLKVNLDKSNIYGINLDQAHISRLAETLNARLLAAYTLSGLLWVGTPGYPREVRLYGIQVILSIYGSHSNGWDANTLVRWSHRCLRRLLLKSFRSFPRLLGFPSKFVWNSQVPFKVQSFIWLFQLARWIGSPEEHP